MSAHPSHRRDVPSIRLSAAALVLSLLASAVAFSSARSGWAPGFQLPGWIDGDVKALALYQGNVIAGGSFHFLDGRTVDSIARWDGASWQPMGSGFDGPVDAMLVQGDTLIAAGDFHHSGSLEVRSVARWDGGSWSPMGTGLDGRVDCLATWKDSLVAGGYFQDTGGQPAQNTAVWNGTSWRPIIQQKDDDPGGYEITSMAAWNDRIYAIRYYAGQNLPPDPDGTPITIQLKFMSGDGTGWSEEESTDHVHFFDPELLQSFQGEIYGAGSYVIDYSVYDMRFGNGVFRWTADGWTQVGQDFPDHTWWEAMATVQGRLTVAVEGGLFQWDGTDWQEVLTLPADAAALVDYNQKLVIGGSFLMHEPYLRNLAAWDGNAWQPLGDQSGAGLNGPVLALARTATGLAASGSFTYAGPAPAKRWALWNAGAWTIPADSVAEAAHPLATYHGDLYAVGALPARCDDYCGGLGRWDGTIWTPVGDFTGGLSSFALFEDWLITAGSFTTPDPFRQNIEAYNGSRWEPLGSGLGSEVTQVASYRGALYAGTTDEVHQGFTWNTVGRILRWNDLRWTSLGDSVGWRALAIQGYDNQLVVSGLRGMDDPDNGTTYQYFLDRWDGSSWQPLGGQPNNAVTALSVYYGDLIASGDFTRIGDVSAAGLARWDGTAWHPFGGGLDQPANTLRVEGDSLWIGGAFQRPGDQPSSGIALWIEPRPSIVLLQAALAESSVVLSWTLPDDPSVRGAVVRFAADGFPVDPRDGDAVPGGETGGVFPGSPGQSMEVRQPVTQGQGSLFYTAFVYTDSMLYSKPATVSIALPDRIPPAITLDLSRQPDTSSVLSIRIEASEKLDSTTVSLSAGGHPLALHPLGFAARVWGASLDFSSVNGVFTLSAAGNDLVGHLGTVQETLSAGTVASAGGTIQSGDGRLRIDVPPGALTAPRRFSAIPVDSLNPAEPMAFLIQPPENLAAPAQVEFQYDDAFLRGRDPLRLRIVCENDSLPSFLDLAQREVIAMTSRIGRFRLVLSGSAASPPLDLDYLRLTGPSPNPSTGSMRFTIAVRARQRIRATIYSVDGRVARHLIDETAQPGDLSATWDGRTDSGKQVASGVYYCRVIGEKKSASLRFVRIR